MHKVASSSESYVFTEEVVSVAPVHTKNFEKLRESQRKIPVLGRSLTRHDILANHSAVEEENTWYSEYAPPTTRKIRRQSSTWNISERRLSYIQRTETVCHDGNRWALVANCIKNEMTNSGRSRCASFSQELMNSDTMTARMLDREVHKMTREYGDILASQTEAQALQIKENMRKRNLYENKDSYSSSIHESYRQMYRTLAQRRKMKTLKPIERFRKIVRLLLFLLKIKTTAHRKATQQKDSGVFAELHDAAEEGLKDLDGMHFDPRMFKAVKEVKLSREAIHILSLSPGTRTEEQLQTVMFALKASVPAFGEYPLKMQRKLLSVGWYERFEAKRVIIRQGHRAENFYFILSGTALVTLLVGDMNAGEQRSSTIAVLTKGSSFGELALLHHKTRSATVLCKDEVSLLAVSREDFRDIFMSYSDGKEPEHIRFLKSVPYLKDLPLDNLASRHDVCIFHYFRRGVVIVRDSKTEWIYIVKSGSCRALTSLVKKKAKLMQSAVKRKEGKFLPIIPIDEIERRRALYTVVGERSRAFQLFPDGKRPITEPAIPMQKSDRMNDLSLPVLVSDTDRFKKTIRNIALPLIAKQNSVQVKRAKEAHRRKIEELHRTVSNTDKKNMKHKEKHQGESEERVFVQLALFKPKDQFGLSTLLYDNAAVKCHLISNGAECVLIKKSWFLQNADEAMLRDLRSQIAPYPSQDALEQNLQDKANWDSYKSQTINDLLDTLQI